MIPFFLAAAYILIALFFLCEKNDAATKKNCLMLVQYLKDALISVVLFLKMLLYQKEIMRKAFTLIVYLSITDIWKSIYLKDLFLEFNDYLLLKFEEFPHTCCFSRVAFFMLFPFNLCVVFFFSSATLNTFFMLS